MKPHLRYNTLVKRDKSCLIMDNLHIMTEKKQYFSFSFPKTFRNLLLYVLLVLALASCQNPGSCYCLDEIVSRSDDYVFVTKTAFESSPISKKHLTYQTKKKKIEQQNRLEQEKLGSSSETIHSGTKLKLRQVYVCRTYIVTSILPSYIKVTKIQYELERVCDGRLVYYNVHIPDQPIEDKEIISPHGSRILDFALNLEDFKKIFSPINKDEQKPIRILSQCGFSRKD